MTIRKKYLALVGCGRISKSHISSIINNHKRCKLVAICDNSKNKLDDAINFIKDEYLKNKLKINIPKIFSKYEDLLNAFYEKNFVIDLIILATPSGYHPSQTIKAAKLGINICTEKPMALNLKDAREMVEFCNERKVKLFVVKQNRLNPTLQDLREKIKKNMFGDIALITINVFWQRPQEYYDQDEWRGTKKLDGGALMNQAIHYVDLLEWLGGSISSISAFTSTRKRNIETEDTAVISIKWEVGTLGSMNVTMLTYPKNLEGSITIIGDKGSAKVGGIALNNYDFFHFENKIEHSEILNKNYLPKNVYGEGHLKYYSNMLDVLEGKDEAICSGDDALTSIKIICAAHKSFNEKRIIDLNTEMDL